MKSREMSYTREYEWSTVFSALYYSNNGMNCTLSSLCMCVNMSMNVHEFLITGLKHGMCIFINIWDMIQLNYTRHNEKITAKWAIVIHSIMFGYDSCMWGHIIKLGTIILNSCFNFCLFLHGWLCTAYIYIYINRHTIYIHTSVCRFVYSGNCYCQWLVSGWH